MSKQNVTPFQKAIDAIEALPIEDQYSIIELINLRLIEHRRLEIAENARQTIRAVKEAKASYGSVDDLKRDLRG
jgi:hypothetical protein